MGVDFDKLRLFQLSGENYVQWETSEWCGIDGKSIKGTGSDYKSEYQNFVNIVSRICWKKRLTSMDKLE